MNDEESEDLDERRRTGLEMQARLPRPGARRQDPVAEDAGGAAELDCVLADFGPIGLLVGVGLPGRYVVGVASTGSCKVAFFGPSCARITQWASGKPALAAADPVAVTVGRAPIPAARLAPGSISGTLTMLGGCGHRRVGVYADDLNGVYTGKGALVPGAPPTTLWFSNRPTGGAADPVAVDVGSTTSGIDQTYPNHCLRAS